MESFQFIHAARLRLDQTLIGTGEIPDSIRPIVEDATLSAFERVVEACLAHEVDFLLLAGDSFDPFERSPRGPAALVAGCEQLAERNIDVVIFPGQLDPWSAWPAGLRLPANVRRAGADAGAIHLTRDGILLAVVLGRSECVAHDTGETPWLLRLPKHQESNFTIQFGYCGESVPILPLSAHDRGEAEIRPESVDYRALGGSRSRRSLQTDGCLAHDPGPAQGIDALESGPCGCTLVEVDAAGGRRSTFLPTASVRWEQLSLSVAPGLSQNDLRHNMHEALRSLSRHATDRVLLLAWNIFGEPAHLKSLLTPDFERALPTSIPAESGFPDVLVHSCALRTCAQPLARETLLEDLLAAELSERIASRGARGVPIAALGRANSALAGGPWEQRMTQLLSQIDPGEVVRTAHRLALENLADFEPANAREALA
jgi:DNA repair protein SbcD/Mre11